MGTKARTGQGKHQSPRQKVVQLQRKHQQLIEKSTKLAIRIHRQAFEDLEKL